MTLKHAADLTIESVRARAVIAPLARPVRTAVGEIPKAPLILIDISSKEGVIGSSYILAYSMTALRALARLIDDVGAELSGKPANPRDIMRFFDTRYRLLGWQGLVGMAISGIDMALWDMRGKALGLPVATLLGAKPRALPAYDSYGIFDPASDGPAIEASVASGFRAIKVKLGDFDLAADREAVRRVREIIGEDVSLMIDYNQSLPVTEAIHRIRALERFGLHWVEEPVKAEDLAGHAAVRAGISTPVQTGENWWMPAGAQAAFAADACDHAMLDLMKIGGVTGWMDAASLSAAAGKPVSSHIFIEASAHVLAATETMHFIEHLDLASALLRTPTPVINGTITPTGTGLGIEWDEQQVTRCLA